MKRLLYIISAVLLLGSCSYDAQRVEVTRSYASQNAVGAVLVHSQKVMDPENPIPGNLAGAIAWASLAERFRVRGKWEESLACARFGIQELGKRYADRTAIDDTEMRLYLAKDAAGDREFRQAAALMMGALYSRITLYRNLHKDTLSLPNGLSFLKKD